MAWKPDRDNVVTVLTLLLVVLWVAVTIARIWVDVPEATILDAAMPVVIGFWFTSSAMTKKPEPQEAS